jgi:hypothetical protein
MEKAKEYREKTFALKHQESFAAQLEPKDEKCGRISAIRVSEVFRPRRGVTQALMESQFIGGFLR